MPLTNTPMKTATSTFAAFAMVGMFLLVLGAGAGNAYAGGGIYIGELQGKVTSVYMKKGDTEIYGDYKKSKKITSAKSSNKKVATVKVKKAGNYTYLVVTKKKAGTTKITYKLAGKKKTANLKVVKWANPVKSVKVGGKEYSSKFKKSTWADTDGGASGKRIKVKAASGWKLQKIQVLGDKIRKVKNGSKLPTDAYEVRIQLKNTKSKVIENVYVY